MPSPLLDYPKPAYSNYARLIIADPQIRLQAGEQAPLREKYLRQRLSDYLIILPANASG